VVTYTGSLPLGKVREIVQQHSVAGPLQEPPPYKFLNVAAPAESRVYFFNKEQAQAQVRIEFADGQVNEVNMPPVQLFKRLLLAADGRHRVPGTARGKGLGVFRWGGLLATVAEKESRIIMSGSIGCQADKTPEALDAFLDLFEKLPASPERFADTRESIISRYRTGKLGFREILWAVRSWGTARSAD